jgi:hypothetical protein
MENLGNNLAEIKPELSEEIELIKNDDSLNIEEKKLAIFQLSLDNDINLIDISDAKQQIVHGINQSYNEIVNDPRLDIKQKKAALKEFENNTKDLMQAIDNPAAYGVSSLLTQEDLLDFQIGYVEQMENLDEDAKDLIIGSALQSKFELDYYIVEKAALSSIQYDEPDTEIDFAGELAKNQYQEFDINNVSYLANYLQIKNKDNEIYELGTPIELSTNKSFIFIPRVNNIDTNNDSHTIINFDFAFLDTATDELLHKQEFDDSDPEQELVEEPIDSLLTISHATSVANNIDNQTYENSAQAIIEKYNLNINTDFKYDDLFGGITNEEDGNILNDPY